MNVPDWLKWTLVVLAVIVLLPVLWMLAMMLFGGTMGMLGGGMMGGGMMGGGMMGGGPGGMMGGGMMWGLGLLWVLGLALLLILLILLLLRSRGPDRPERPPTGPAT